MFFNDPKFVLSNLELQRDQITYQVERARQELAKHENNLKVVNAQIVAIKEQLPGQPQSQAVPASGMSQIGQALQARGLTVGQLQGALNTEDGKALMKMFEDEIVSLAKQNVAAQPEPIQ